MATQSRVGSDDEFEDKAPQRNPAEVKELNTVLQTIIKSNAVETAKKMGLHRTVDLDSGSGTLNFIKTVMQQTLLPQEIAQLFLSKEMIEESIQINFQAAQVDEVRFLEEQSEGMTFKEWKKKEARRQDQREALKDFTTSGPPDDHDGHQGLDDTLTSGDIEKAQGVVDDISYQLLRQQEGLEVAKAELANAGEGDNAELREAVEKIEEEIDLAEVLLGDVVIGNVCI
jgi:hypothetical protein